MYIPCNISFHYDDILIKRCLKFSTEVKWKAWELSYNFHMRRRYQDLRLTKVFFLKIMFLTNLCGLLSFVFQQLN